jgi:hypothetical protein
MEKVQSCTKHQTVLEPNQAKLQNQRGGRVVLALLARKKMPLEPSFSHTKTLQKYFIFFRVKNLHDIWQMLIRQYLPYCPSYLFHTLRQ